MLRSRDAGVVFEFSSYHQAWIGRTSSSYIAVPMSCIESSASQPWAAFCQGSSLSTRALLRSNATWVSFSMKAVAFPGSAASSVKMPDPVRTAETVNGPS
ncbi:hypothetical protein ACFLSJ_07370 [Verrucomicrobiota bacterium]